MKIHNSTQIGSLPNLRATHHVYNGMDTMLTHELSYKLEELVKPVQTSADFSHKLLGPVLSMMHRGFRMDTTKIDGLVLDRQERIAKLKATLNEFANWVWGKDLNHNSNPQLKEFLYNQLALPVITRMDKGEEKVSTDEKALLYLAHNYVRAKPFCEIILRIKELKGELDVLATTLVNGRFLYSFNIGGTDTFRYSSSKHPTRFGRNIQNITGDLRQVFIPDEGYTLVSCDLKGAESRAVAYLSGDENYIKANESSDVHTMVASMVWGFPPERQLADRVFERGLTYRFLAKKAGHGSSYGGTPKTLATQIGVPVKLIEGFQNDFFKTFPGLREWQQWVAMEIQSKGLLVTPFGRRRVFWDRRWDDATVRAAIAYGPQSLIGDWAHVQEYKIWYEFEPEVQLLANGHDAVIFQIPTDKVAELLPRVLESITFPLEVTDIKGIKRQLVVPVETKIGHNWADYDPDKNPNGLKEWKSS